MLDVLNSPEIHRLSLVIGAFIAVNYKEKYGVIPSGIIIPGFLITLFLISPIWCLTLIALTFPVFWVYKRFLNRTDYKLRTPMYILSVLSLAIASLTAFVYVQFGWLSLSLDTLSGGLVPAIISYTCIRQKMVEVLKGTALVTVLTTAIIFMVYAVGTYGLNLNFDTIQPFYQGKDTFELKYSLLQFYSALITGYLIYRFMDVRSGGYMITPIAASLLINPLSAAMFLLGCFVTYGLTQVIYQLTLIIGLKRYVLALFISTVFVWFTEIIFIQLDSTVMPFRGSNTFVIIAMMSYANDAILYAKKNVYVFMTITLGIALVTLLISHILSNVFI